MAAQAAQIGRRTHYDWLKSDTEYSAEYHRAIDDACDALEQECHRRATGPKGSDILLMFLMKKRNPAFRDRVEHSGGVKVQHDMTFKVEFDDLITLPPRTAQPVLEQHNGSNGAA